MLLQPKHPEGPLLRRGQAIGLIVAAGLSAACPPASTASHAPQKPVGRTFRVRIGLAGRSLTATLVDNPTTRDLVSLLPLELPGKDFMHFEKIAYLPRKLTTRDAPPSYTPVAGDFAYFDPWGNLALFHDDWRPSPGLVHLGRFDGPVDALRIKGEMPVRVELIQ